MAQPTIKTSFASGEWAPKLLGRVDIQKYHSGAAYLRNFFVDYAGGGASTRAGTAKVIQCKTLGSRMIPFQPASDLGFALEFGDHYIRFFFQGSPLLEAFQTITAITKANPGVVTIPTHGYSDGDWILLLGGDMTELGTDYFIVQNTTANTFTLATTTGVAVDTTTYTTYTGGGSAARVYTITSPYAATDLFPNPLTGNPGIKFVQDVNSMVITHPNYTPQILTETSVLNWSINAISFGPTIDPPGGLVFASNLAAGTFFYGYQVTAVDANGQESAPSGTITNGAGLANILNTAGTNTLTWTAVAGAVSYNVYRTSPTVTVAIPAGVQYGFVGNVTSTTFTETTPGIAPDFSQGPPISPFGGSSVKSLTLGTNANYTTVPSISIAPPPSGITANGIVYLGLNTITPSAYHVLSYDPTQGNVPVSPVGGKINLPNGAVGTITSATQFSAQNYTVNAVSVTAQGSKTGAGSSVPASSNGTAFTPPAPTYVLAYASGTLNLAWNVKTLTVIQHGAGYTTPPAVTFSSGAATATAVLGPGPTGGGQVIDPLSAGFPSVCGFFQQRLVLAAPPGAVQTYFMSQPGIFFNFSGSFPAQDDDGIQGSIIAEDLNDIRSLISVPTGLLALAGKGAWLINGGGGLSVNTPITPADQTASPQGFAGANDVKPIKVNQDLLYITNKGNYVRDLSYNLYAALYSGTDISVLSNHLFFNHYIIDWCWSEEPFKTAWAIREDGKLLSLAYVKDQELVGWAHHDTDGQFQSCCSVIEILPNGNTVDAVYFVVQRYINGQFVSSVERQADRYFTYGKEDSWCVDSAVTNGYTYVNGNLYVLGNASIGNTVTLIDTDDNPFTSAQASQNWVVRASGGIYKITSFTSISQVSALVLRQASTFNPVSMVVPTVTDRWSISQPFTQVGGLKHLVGKTVTGVADGIPITPQVVPSNGVVNLPQASTAVICGLPFTPQLKTLPLDLGEPTAQSKRKKLPAVTLRVADTLGLQVGTSFDNVVTMKDFQLNAIPSQSNGAVSVTDLVNTDLSQTYIDGYQKLDQVWQELGQLCVQQNLPYPATIIAIIPEVTVGDTK